jgi:hypothetical protein
MADFTDKPMTPKKSPEPTAIGRVSSSENAMECHAAVTRWLSFFR